MKNLIPLALLLAGPAAAQWGAGFDFRATQSFVVDPAGSTWASAEVAYPTSRIIDGQVVTFGWETQGAGGVDYFPTGIDPRLAGAACRQNGTSATTFRVDLPAIGAYDIQLAVGNARWSVAHHASILSGSSVVLSLDGETFGGWFFDAMMHHLYASQWVDQGAASRKIFTSTIFRISLGGGSDNNFSCLAHLRLVQIPVPAVPKTHGKSFFLQ